MKVRYPSTELYQGGVVTRFATKNRQDQVTMVDGSPLAYELETQYLTPYDAANASRRGSRTLQLEMIRKELRGGSPDEVIYSVAKAARDQRGGHRLLRSQRPAGRPRPFPQPAEVR